MFRGFLKADRTNLTLSYFLQKSRFCGNPTSLLLAHQCHRKPAAQVSQNKPEISVEFNSVITNPERNPLRFKEF